MIDFEFPFVTRQKYNELQDHADQLAYELEKHNEFASHLLEEGRLQLDLCDDQKTEIDAASRVIFTLHTTLRHVRHYVLPTCVLLGAAVGIWVR